MTTLEISDQLHNNAPICRAFGCLHWDETGSMIFSTCTKYQDVKQCLMSCIDNTCTLARNYISVEDIDHVTDDMVKQGLHVMSQLN